MKLTIEKLYLICDNFALDTECEVHTEKMTYHWKTDKGTAYNGPYERMESIIDDMEVIEFQIYDDGRKIKILVK